MPFTPPDFEIPRRLEHAEFRLRPLTIHDVIKDYAAVMTSLDRLAGVFGPGNDWPRRWEEHTSELQSRRKLVCRLLLEKKKQKIE